MTADAPAAVAAAPKATPSADGERVALRDAIWRLERALRQRLAAAERGVQPAAAHHVAADTADARRARLLGLRRAARRLGAGGAELIRKVRALEPLLYEVERRERAGVASQRPSIWKAEVPAERLDAAAAATCGKAATVGEGRFLVELGAGAEVWLRHRGKAAGMLLVSTAGSELDTVVEVFDSCPSAAASPLAAGDDEIGLQARTAWRAADGETSWIRVSGWEGAQGAAVVTLDSEVAGFAGAITREDTGEALRYRDVEVWAQDGSYAGYTESDSDGVYVMVGLSPGNYFASTVRPYSSDGLLDEVYDDLPCPVSAPQGCDPTTGTPIAVTADVILTRIDFELGTGSEITGRVRDAATGAPVLNAQVEVFGPTGNFIDDVLTDVAGRYTIGGLGNGTVYARAGGGYGSQYGRELYSETPCGSCNVTSGTPIAVAVGQTTAGIDFSLDEVGAIAGTVTRAQDGSPIDYADLEIWDSQGKLRDWTYANGSGQYVFDGLEPGTYFVTTDVDSGFLDELYDNIPCAPSCTPASGTPIVVTRGSTTSGVNFALRRLGAISGTLTDAANGAVIPYGYVDAFDGAGNFAGYGYVNSSGTYTISGLAAGQYYVYVGADAFRPELYNDIPCAGSPPSGCSFATGTLVSVQIDTTTGGINFALDRMGGISGTVTDQTTGAALNDGLVYVWNAAGQTVAYEYLYGGAYQVDGLPTGTYYVTAARWDYAPELYNGLACPGGGPPTCNPASGTPVSVTLGTTRTGVNFTLVRKGTIAGTVRDAPTGTTIPYPQVVVYNAAGNWVTTASGSSDGTYQASGLESGNYFLVARASGHSARLYNGLPCPGGSCTPTSGNPVPVTVGGTTAGVDFSLPRMGTVTGLVSSGGTPLPYVSVTLYAGNGSWQNSTYTGSDGRYQLAAEAGTWFLVAGSNSDYAPELYSEIPCPGGFCNVAAGTPVSVTSSATTSGIDFTLGIGRGIMGCVVGEAAQPLPGVAIDLWNAAGVHVASAATGPNGCYRLVPNSGGTYFVSTDSALAVVEELWNNVLCPMGSAYANRCDPTAGTPINLPSSSALVTGIDFTLDVGRIFRSGFESGDGGWSASSP